MSEAVCGVLGHESGANEAGSGCLGKALRGALGNWRPVLGKLGLSGLGKFGVLGQGFRGAWGKLEVGWGKNRFEQFELLERLRQSREQLTPPLPLIRY